MNRPAVNPYLVLFIGALSVSTSAVLVKMATAPAPVIAAYRLLLTVVIMLPVVLLFFRHELKHIHRKDWTASFVAGLLLALHFIFWFESLEYTSVASSVVLVTLQPIFAFIGTYFFYKEHLTLGAVLSGLLAICGSFIISWGDFGLNPRALFGDFLAIIGAIMVTGYFLVGQTVRKRVSLAVYTFVVYSISAGLLFAYSFILDYSFHSYPGQDWVIFLLLALVPTLLGHTLFNWTVKYLSTSIISMSILFEPIGASILAYYILGETITLSQASGGFLILLGIFLFLLIHKRKRKFEQ